MQEATPVDTILLVICVLRRVLCDFFQATGTQGDTEPFLTAGMCWQVGQHGPTGGAGATSLHLCAVTRLQQHGMDSAATQMQMLLQCESLSPTQVAMPSVEGCGGATSLMESNNLKGSIPGSISSLTLLEKL